MDRIVTNTIIECKGTSAFPKHDFPVLDLENAVQQMQCPLGLAVSDSTIHNPTAIENVVKRDNMSEAVDSSTN